MEHPLLVCVEKQKELKEDIYKLEEMARDNIKRIYDKMDDSNRMLAENNALLCGTMEKINGFVQQSDIKDGHLEKQIESLDKKIELHEKTKHLKPWAWVSIFGGLLGIIWVGGEIIDRYQNNQNTKQGETHEIITRQIATNSGWQGDVFQERRTTR